MAEGLAPGRLAAVAVGVSTVWTSPDAPRPCDAPAVAPAPRLADWAAGMTTAQRKDLQGRTLTQVLFGDVVAVEEVAAGWARVVAAGQAAPALDPRGYPGWVPAAHLAPGDPGDLPGEQYVVDAMTATLHERPEAASPAVDVPFGTRLTAAGPASGGRVPVTAPGRAAPLWADPASLAPVAGQPAPAGRGLLAVAARFQGVPYVWGGVSPYGIDCSGLVHLAHRRLGVVVPRDAGDQAGASDPVRAPRAGDLYFFADPGAPADHVGLVSGPGRILHASGAAGQVLEEPLPGRLARRLAPVHRTLP